MWRKLFSLGFAWVEDFNKNAAWSCSDCCEKLYFHRYSTQFQANRLIGFLRIKEGQCSKLVASPHRVTPNETEYTANKLAFIQITALQPHKQVIFDLWLLKIFSYVRQNPHTTTQTHYHIEKHSKIASRQLYICQTISLASRSHNVAQTTRCAKRAKLYSSTVSFTRPCVFFYCSEARGFCEFSAFRRRSTKCTTIPCACKHHNFVLCSPCFVWIDLD